MNILCTNLENIPDFFLKRKTIQMLENSVKIMKKSCKKSRRLKWNSRSTMQLEIWFRRSRSGECAKFMRNFRKFYLILHMMSHVLFLLSPRFWSAPASVTAWARKKICDAAKRKYLNNPKKFWRISTSQYPATWRSFPRLVRTFHTLSTFLQLFTICSLFVQDFCTKN